MRRPFPLFASERLVFMGLGLAAAVFLLPLYVVSITAFKPLHEIMTGTMLAPASSWTLEPMRKAWSSVCIGTSCEGLRGGFLTSALVTIPAVFISVTIGFISGFSLAKGRVQGSNLLFALVIVANFLPYQAVLLPIAITLRHLGLFGSLPGLVLVHVAYGIPYTILLFRNAFLGLPDGVIHAARLEGASFWKILIHVCLPMSAPMLAVAVVLQFTAIWNDYLFGLVLGGANPTVTVKLNNLINHGLGAKEYNVNMAGVLIAAAPSIAVYWLAGRWFARGLALVGAR